MGGGERTSSLAPVQPGCATHGCADPTPYNASALSTVITITDTNTIAGDTPLACLAFIASSTAYYAIISQACNRTCVRLSLPRQRC